MRGEEEDAEPSLTATGQILGTVAYMSPEQACGRAVDQRTDLWSLGVIAYEMLAGVSPFQAETRTAVLSRILHEEPPPLKKARNDMISTCVRFGSPGMSGHL